MTLFERLGLRSVAAHMIAVLGLSFAALLTLLTAVELSGQGGIAASAESDYTMDRLKRMQPILRHIAPDEMGAFLASASTCHDGYEASDRPYPYSGTTPETRKVAAILARGLGLNSDAVRAGRAMLTRGDFAYAKCGPGQMDFPFEGLVVSIRQPAGIWVHAEVHPHEWHFRQTFLSWFQRSVGAFLLVAAIATFFMLRLGRPLRRLAEAALRFGNGLKVEPVEESGPPDVRRMIEAFNAMQLQVGGEIARRTHVLAALSHDLRTPLTALRVKAELVDDLGVRDELVASIRKMEALSASAIEFLQGECRAEPLRTVDVRALVESECADFQDMGAAVEFDAAGQIHCRCRPEALARAVRNLIDNAIKYGGSAAVTVSSAGGSIEIGIADRGPGIPPEQAVRALEPFVRLSSAREGETGGFGLGLSVAHAVAEGHGGTLTLGPNKPTGLIAVIHIPARG